jgi:hypothetical protein
MTNLDLCPHEKGLEEQIRPAVSALLHSITSTGPKQQWKGGTFYFFTALAGTMRNQPRRERPSSLAAIARIETISTNICEVPPRWLIRSISMHHEEHILALPLVVLNSNQMGATNRGGLT